MFEGRVLGQIAETRDLQIVVHLLQHLEMTGGTHLIKYDARYADILSEVDKAREQSCRRVGCRLGIHHEDDGDVEYTGNLVGRTSFTVVAVEESHHAFHDTDVGL